MGAIVPLPFHHNNDNTLYLYRPFVVSKIAFISKGSIVNIDTQEENGSLIAVFTKYRC